MSNKKILNILSKTEQFLENFFNILSSPSYKRTISLLILFLITLSIPVTTLLMQKGISITQYAETDPPTTPSPTPNCNPSGVPQMFSTITTDLSPYAVTIDETTDTLYVTNYNGTNEMRYPDNPEHRGNISSIKINEDKSFNVQMIKGEISADNPQGIAVNSNTQKLYIVKPFDRRLAVISTTDFSNFKYIPVGDTPKGIAINRTTNTIYVANHGENSVEGGRSISVVDGNSDTEIAKIPIKGRGVFGAVDEVSNTAYFTSFDIERRANQEVIAIDSNNNILWQKVPSTGEPFGITVDSATHNVYVTTNDSGGFTHLSPHIVVFDQNGNEIMTKSFPSTNINAIGINSYTGRIYAGLNLGDSISQKLILVLDKNLNEITRFAPGGLAWTGTFVIHPKTGLVFGTIVGGNPNNKVAAIQDTALDPACIPTPLPTQTIGAKCYVCGTLACYYCAGGGISCGDPCSTPITPVAAPTYTQRNPNGLFAFDPSLVSPVNIPYGPSAVSNVSNTFISLLVALGIILSIAFLIYAGIKFITAGGDKEKIESARRTITYAIIGLLIIVLSFAIIRLLGNIIGARFNI